MRSREVEECVRDVIVSCEGCTKSFLLPSCNFSFCAWSSSNKEISYLLECLHHSAHIAPLLTIIHYDNVTIFINSNFINFFK